MHKEFLGVSGEDPRRALAEQLCQDIPMNVCVTAYNKSFECTRIKELAGWYPDLAEHLLDIKENIKGSGENPIRPEKMVDVEAGYAFESPRFSAGANVYLMDPNDLTVISKKLDGYIFYPLFVIDLAKIYYK